eukprot:1152956-Pelagomonas_calceolata.AAC.1
MQACNAARCALLDPSCLTADASTKEPNDLLAGSFREEEEVAGAADASSQRKFTLRACEHQPTPSSAVLDTTDARTHQPSEGQHCCMPRLPPGTHAAGALYALGALVAAGTMCKARWGSTCGLRRGQGEATPVLQLPRFRCRLGTLVRIVLDSMVWIRVSMWAREIFDKTDPTKSCSSTSLSSKLNMKPVSVLVAWRQRDRGGDTGVVTQV